MDEDAHIGARGKFRQLNEDDTDLSCRTPKNESAANQPPPCSKQLHKTDKWPNLIKSSSILTISNNLSQTPKPNFSLEPTPNYPAVVFDNVNFSVERASQESANVIDRVIGCCPILPSCLASKRERVEILKSINMSVPQGSIFGLLGPSSCGKSTLLRCLVGLIKPNSGQIRLLGSGNSDDPVKVPGSSVGYMPQDLGLYPDFTIEQILTMFGRYMRMPEAQIKSRITFMSKFLDLPKVNRRIDTLSGGQQRRVSFAIALIHMPPLIILDEPTVGVDPLLRKSIWRHLRRLASEQRRTIIITTHYIEEAAQADQVALMRAGEILVQDSPRRIMQMHGSTTLEEAFLRICSARVEGKDTIAELAATRIQERLRLYPQSKFTWHDQIDDIGECDQRQGAKNDNNSTNNRSTIDAPAAKISRSQSSLVRHTQLPARLVALDSSGVSDDENANVYATSLSASLTSLAHAQSLDSLAKSRDFLFSTKEYAANKRGLVSFEGKGADKSHSTRISDCTKWLKSSWKLWLALLYKNYRRNVNSVPLIAFQFLLPIVQMVTFALCIGGRPQGVRLGLVNLDEPVMLRAEDIGGTGLLLQQDDLAGRFSLADAYVSFIDREMLDVRPYSRMSDALADVRRARLWGAMEIGDNFTRALLARFEPDNFNQLDKLTIDESVVRLRADSSNKILDLICVNSLVKSYRKFLYEYFEQFRSLPIELRTPVFDIKPNAISNSIDGYTESVAAAMLASLTYIMAAGFTTFVMVVERSEGILERTYTCGIHPVAYLLAHAIFRSMAMSLQIALVMFFTFYLLQQPLVGSAMLAFVMLMALNFTGISFGLLISSFVRDQNGAAFAVVGSLVGKLTMSGIIWPLEAVPHWLRVVCYIQPLTLPVQAIRAITLKGAHLSSHTQVQLGLLSACAWSLVFVAVASRRFKFYQHD